MQLKRLSFYLLVAVISLQCKHKNKTTDEFHEPDMDGMDRAMRQEFMMTRDPILNRIPSERLTIARAYMQSLVSTSRTSQTTALSWQERGPSNVGGRTRSILVDKRDATGNTVFAGSISGGLFKTTNFTNATPTWTAVNDFLPNLAIACMVQDNNNQNIMYAG